MNDSEAPPGRRIVARVLIELVDGTRYATAWVDRAEDARISSLAGVFSGRLAVRVLGSEEAIPPSQVERVIEETAEYTLEKMDSPLPLVRLVRAPSNTTPKGRKLLDRVEWYAHNLPGMSLELIDQIIDDPKITWAGRNGATIVSDGRFQIVVGEEWGDGVCIMRITQNTPDDVEQPVLPRTPPGSAMRRVAGTKADRRLPVPKSVPDFHARLKERGFVIDGSRRHYSISHPETPGVNIPMPHTPSDYRWAENLAAQVRSVFGVDIRQPPA